MSRASGTVEVGDIVRVAFSDRNPTGHEQVGFRPAIVVGLPEHIAIPRYPLLIVVPMTRDGGDRRHDFARVSPGLYPRLPGGAGPRYDSIALLDQVCAVDTFRVKGFHGMLEFRLLEHVQNGLRAILRL